jgi:hypothetical protein
MKKLIALIAIVSATMIISSCKAIANLKEKCPESKVEKLDDGRYKSTVKCTHLYATEELKKYASEGSICYDWLNGELYAVTTSRDSIPNLSVILQKVAKAVKNTKQAK